MSMDEAVKHIDKIIEDRGECIIGSIIEMLVRCDRDTIANELKARGYVVRSTTTVKNGYVVYPKRKKTSPHFVIQFV